MTSSTVLTSTPGAWRAERLTTPASVPGQRLYDMVATVKTLLVPFRKLSHFGHRDHRALACGTDIQKSLF